jgi:hypothetical protein
VSTGTDFADELASAAGTDASGDTDTDSAVASTDGLLTNASGGMGLITATPTSSVALSGQASSSLTSGQRQFAATLSADTGLSPTILSAWLLAENQGARRRRVSRRATTIGSTWDTRTRAPTTRRTRSGPTPPPRRRDGRVAAGQDWLPVTAPAPASSRSARASGNHRHPAAGDPEVGAGPQSEIRRSMPRISSRLSLRGADDDCRMTKAPTPE